MCPDHCAIDHVGCRVSSSHFRQRFEHCVEHTSLDPSSVAAEHAVPFAIFVGQMPPLRARPRHPHHTLIVEPVILRRAAPPTSFRGQQWPDQCPFIVRHSNSLAQDCLPKDSLKSTYQSPCQALSTKPSLTPVALTVINLFVSNGSVTVEPIVLDGSNVSLSGAGAGKLTSLAILAQMVHCLLANGFTPYTIFDASFKHRISESSVGRSDFNYLTKQLSEYFQMSPSGEEADLFLLQLALDLKCPVVSNDTLKNMEK